MNYHEQVAFNLRVSLARSEEELGELEVEAYETNDINDAALPRHFGITTVNGKPLFDGFCPKRER